MLGTLQDCYTKKKLTKLVNDFSGQPVVVNIVGSAGFKRLRSGARWSPTRERGQPLLTDHKGQDASRSKEHVEEERLPV